MADSKLTGLSATTAPVSTDVFYIVTDPGGTPTSNKVTGANMGKALTLVGKVTVTQPASSATLTLTDGKTLAVTNTLTLSGTDSTVMTFPAASDTVAGLATLNIFTVAQTLRKNSSDAVAPILSFKKARGTGTTVIVTADVLASLDAYGYDGSNDLLMGQILINSTGTIASTRVPTTIVFKTATNAAPSVLTTALTIRSDQSLNIGGVAAPGTSTAPALTFGTTTSCGFYRDADIGANALGFSASTTCSFRFTQAEISFPSNGLLTWGNQVNTIASSSTVLGIKRNADGILEINSGTGGTFRDLTLRNVVGQTGYHEMAEMTAPGGGAANTVRLYADDSGGKTRLMAIFNSGAAQQVAIEP